jgi:hypothetical protein
MPNHQYQPSKVNETYRDARSELAPSTTAGEQSIMDHVTANITTARQQVADEYRRAHDIADAVFGGGPETGSADEPRAPVSGKAGTLQREVESLFEIIAALRGQIDRLTCI